MTRRRSSGSRRADIAVESTRSQNITVRWRRSPSLGCALGLAVARGRLAAGGLVPDRAARACFLPLIRAPSTWTRIVAERVRPCQGWAAERRSVSRRAVGAAPRAQVCRADGRADGHRESAATTRYPQRHDEELRRTRLLADPRA